VGIRHVAEAIGQARDVELSAWTLRAGVLERALERAADAGARVRVHLEGRPYSDSQVRARRLHRQNVAVAAALRRHGAVVDLRSDPDVPLHLKAAVVDGTAFLDERNWADGDAVIVSNARPGDVALVREAFDGRAGASAGFATRKDAALALEAALIARAPAGAPIRFATESFGPGPVAAELEARARSGADVRVLVDRLEARESAGARERSALGRLRAAGAQVRATSRPAKECVAGSDAWAGSANATAGRPGTLDWGMRTAEPQLVDALAREFERTWAGARPLR
jgi:phosphatidylserine/phosphatidylglycerophosphate/cardiolipin synthase-like enzyme